MLDLLIYLFENYLSTKPKLDINDITLELEEAGFNNKDISSAFDWFNHLEKISQQRAKSSEQDDLILFMLSCLYFLAAGHVDFNELEQKIGSMVNDFSATIMQTLLNSFFSKAWFLTNLKQYAGTLGMRFKEYRPITIQLGNGCRVPINSPYFVKAASKRKKTKQKKGDAHLGLSICGFISHVSPCLQSKVVLPQCNVQTWKHCCRVGV